MKYLTFPEYVVMGGQLSNEEFERFEFRAEKEIDRCTQSRLHNVDSISEEVKRCMYELVDFLSLSAGSGAIHTVKSESNDGVSVSYASDNDSPWSDSYNIVYAYLAESGLMYCGV